jgi:hypothetical protein
MQVRISSLALLVYWENRFARPHKKKYKKNGGAPQAAAQQRSKNKRRQVRAKADNKYEMFRKNKYEIPPIYYFPIG